MKMPPVEWLGTEVATVVQSGERKEPERHVMVSGQVRGYLRWYGDLTKLRGYWPLAEAIAQSLYCAGEEREALSNVLALFAEEWDCTAATVHSAVSETVQCAIELHPAFASQVLGGLSASQGVLQYVKASAHWLAIHRLALSKDGCEAFWQFWPMYRMERSAKYISREDFRIVQQHAAGRSFQEIASDLGETVAEVNSLYQRTLERAAAVLQVAHGKPGDSIETSLKRMGVQPWIDGVKELAVAIRLVQADSSLLDNGAKTLYAAVAREMDITPGQVSYRLHKAMDTINRNNRQHMDYDDIYKSLGLKRGARIQAVVTALARYVETEQAVWRTTSASRT